MIERKSIVDQIEVPVEGGIAIRMALLLVEDGKVISRKWHRTLIPADVSPAEQMAYINDHLTSMGEAVITSDDIQRVGMFHRLSTELPSQNAMAKTIDESVAEIKQAKASTVVDAK